MDGFAGPPHKQRYLRYDGSSTAATTDAANGAAKPASAGALLAQLKEELFTTAAFARLLKALTTIGFLGHQAEVRRFRCGGDVELKRRSANVLGSQRCHVALQTCYVL